MGYRALFSAGIITTLQTYAAANPTLLRGIYTVRPASIRELPCAYIDSIDATLDLFSGVRQSHLTATVTFADITPDNAEAAARQDVLVDGLYETFSAAKHMVDGYSLVTPRGYTERLVSDGSVPYSAFDYTLVLEAPQGWP